jgi:hypothetical protein
MMNVDIHSDLITPLQNISFSTRYKELCGNKEYNPSLINFDELIIPNYIKQQGYELKYSKREKFYKIDEKKGALKIQFNIIPNNGFIQLVWDVKIGNNRLYLGYGMWESITDNLDLLDNKTDKFTR